MGQCYMTAGIYELCVDQDQQNNNNGEQEEEFELEDALECAQLDIDEDAANYYAYQNNANGGNNGYNYNQNDEQDAMEFFVGPYCSSNGKSILLGVFMDEVCSYPAVEGIYENTHYGQALPYSSESIVSNDCISCMQPGENDGNNNNNYNNYNNNGDNYNYNYNQNQEDAEVLEVCERLYEEAGKCETDLNVYGVYPNTMACEFINGLNAWGKTRIFSSFTEVKNATPKVLAGFFASTTLLFGGVIYYFHKKIQGQDLGLVHGGGNMA